LDSGGSTTVSYQQVQVAHNAAHVILTEVSPQNGVEVRRYLRSGDEGEFVGSFRYGFCNAVAANGTERVLIDRGNSARDVVSTMERRGDHLHLVFRESGGPSWRLGRLATVGNQGLQVLVEEFTGTSRLVLDDTHIYWGDLSGIWRVLHAGGPPERVAEQATDSNAPWRISAVADSKAYAVSTSLVEFPLDVGRPRTLLTSPDFDENRPVIFLGTGVLVTYSGGTVGTTAQLRSFTLP
jgi:hypothetical protein